MWFIYDSFNTHKKASANGEKCIYAYINYLKTMLWLIAQVFEYIIIMLNHGNGFFSLYTIISEGKKAFNKCFVESGWVLVPLTPWKKCSQFNIIKLVSLWLEKKEKKNHVFIVYTVKKLVLPINFVKCTMFIIYAAYWIKNFPSYNNFSGKKNYN